MLFDRRQNGLISYSSPTVEKEPSFDGASMSFLGAVSFNFFTEK
ncbi:hypothetical protein MXMO3_00024 [Maritalea myrionectae]|uniref:Uncharacterized protein n=1 Tax=Maritalea myrionectae TaxID=454601 RepID=A0A2R4M967_9HYPH|nr:hypothetical protein MXMO3_00024 [Maritalea myrionectae]